MGSQGVPHTISRTRNSSCTLSPSETWRCHSCAAPFPRVPVRGSCRSTCCTQERHTPQNALSHVVPLPQFSCPPSYFLGAATWKMQLYVGAQSRTSCYDNTHACDIPIRVTHRRQLGADTRESRRTHPYTSRHAASPSVRLRLPSVKTRALTGLLGVPRYWGGAGTAHC